MGYIHFHDIDKILMRIRQRSGLKPSGNRDRSPDVIQTADSSSLFVPRGADVALTWQCYGGSGWGGRSTGGSRWALKNFWLGVGRGEVRDTDFEPLFRVYLRKITRWRRGGKREQLTTPKPYPQSLESKQLSRESETRNPKPNIQTLTSQSRNPKPQTSNLKPQTLNHKPQT